MIAKIHHERMIFMDTLACAQVLWDYLCMNQPPQESGLHCGLRLL